MNNARHFSQEQKAYMAAKAFYEMQYKAARDYDLVMDAECERLGIETPFGILPEGHPLLPQAQVNLNNESAAREILYRAGHNLFDWATETTLTKMGTPSQKQSFRNMVARVKEMAHVETHYEEMVKLCMSLDTTAKRKRSA